MRQMEMLREDTARARLAAAADMTKRHEIRSPAGGTVLAHRLPNPGSVARPREGLLEVVPTLAEPELTFRVSPNYVESVLAGRTVEIRLPGLVARKVPPLRGVVTGVAPDIVQAIQPMAPHYLARARLDMKSLVCLEGIAIAQGFSAQIFVLGRERTLLAYLTSPLADGIRRALREG